MLLFTSVTVVDPAIISVRKGLFPINKCITYKMYHLHVANKIKSKTIKMEI